MLRKSSFSDDAPVAQWIEQKVSNLLVAGPIPARRTMLSIVRGTLSVPQKINMKTHP
jgi:hypothetical protein